LPTRSGWERKAAAHAEIFRLLAEIAGEPAAGNLGGGAGFIRELMRAVGPAANGMITSSRRGVTCGVQMSWSGTSRHRSLPCRRP